MTGKWILHENKVHSEIYILTGSFFRRWCYKHGRTFIMLRAGRMTPILIGSSLTNPLAAQSKQ